MATKKKQLLDGRFGSLDLKKIKTLSSGAYEANIYLDGRLVGDVYEEGCGGEPWVTIYDPRDKEEYEAQIQHWTDCTLLNEGVDWNGLGSNDGLVLEEIIEYKERIKFAKSELRKGATSVVVIGQAPKSARELGVYGHSFLLGTDIKVGPNPKNVAHVIACEMMKRDDPLTQDGAHDRITVIAADGQLLDEFVDVHIVWEDHRQGLTKEAK